MVTLNCQVCHSDYSVLPYRKLISKHCSRECHNSVAGTKGGAAGKGRPKTPSKRPDLAEYNSTHARRGPQNPRWIHEGHAQAYSTIHLKVNRLFTKGTSCESCGKTGLLHWSNKDHRYSIKKRDWQTLCPKCHGAYDAKHKLKQKTSR